MRLEIRGYEKDEIWELFKNVIMLLITIVLLLFPTFLCPTMRFILVVTNILTNRQQLKMKNTKKRCTCKWIKITHLSFMRCVTTTVTTGRDTCEWGLLIWRWPGILYYSRKTGNGNNLFQQKFVILFRRFGLYIWILVNKIKAWFACV